MSAATIMGFLPFFSLRNQASFAVVVNEVALQDTGNGVCGGETWAEIYNGAGVAVDAVGGRELDVSGGRGGRRFELRGVQ